MTARVTVKQVLVGVDFDEASAAAVGIAGAFADAFGASLVAVHAASVDVPAYFTPTQMESLEAEQQEKRSWLAGRVREFIAAHRAAVPDVQIGEGPAAGVLLQLSRQADVLVLGTHRLKGPQRWWLGSVAEAVVRASTVPVLVVPATDQGVPALRPGAVLLAPAATGDPLIEGWLETLREALVGEVQRTPAIDTCPVERLRRADLVVVPLAEPHTPSFEHVIHVLRECTHPVLFIPSASSRVS